MKKRILHNAFQLTLRILLKLLSLAVFAGRGMGFFVAGLSRSFRGGGRLVTPAVLFIYLRFRQFRARLYRLITPLRGHLFYLLGHRYFVHSLVIVLVLFASVPSLLAADISPSVIGGQLLLDDLVKEDEREEVIIDDTLPPQEFDSYLEGRFQDQTPPPDTGEVGMPLALEGEALLRPDLPSTKVPLTRTAITEYMVEPGDTIWAIAEKFGVSVSTILWENKLSLYSLIRPGQKVAILPISGVSHTIRKGDTLSAIAKRYNASVDEIKALNQIAETGGTLAAGVKLVIPGGHPYSAPTLTPSLRREVVVPPSVAAIPGGKLLWPTVQRRITQYYRWKHAGVDIGGKTGVDPIYAAEAGVVEVSGWGKGGWGNTVVVNHGNGMKTRYSHASKLLVSPGEAVQKGQAIALIGSTGRSTGPHVDFRIYVNGRTVNPLQYLK